MSVFEVHSRITRRSLMNKSKDELATMVLEGLDREDKIRKKLNAYAEPAREAAFRRLFNKHGRKATNMFGENVTVQGHNMKIDAIVFHDPPMHDTEYYEALYR